MNPFQKQLLLKDSRSMAELSNPERDGIGQPLPPPRVSVEEFANNCEHGTDGYCFKCVRKRHNEEMLDAYYEEDELNL